MLGTSLRKRLGTLASGSTFDVSNALQRDRWGPLSVAPDFFLQSKKQPIDYIYATDHKRKIYFLDCENIAFQNKEGEDIWSTTGDGEIDLPANVGVYIYKGTSRVG